MQDPARVERKDNADILGEVDSMTTLRSDQLGTGFQEQAFSILRGESRQA
jgi:hypothetical protein